MGKVRRCILFVGCERGCRYPEGHTCHPVIVQNILRSEKHDQTLQAQCFTDIGSECNAMRSKSQEHIYEGWTNGTRYVSLRETPEADLAEASNTTVTFVELL